MQLSWRLVLLRKTKTRTIIENDIDWHNRDSHDRTTSKLAKRDRDPDAMHRTVTVLRLRRGIDHCERLSNNRFI